MYRGTFRLATAATLLLFHSTIGFAQTVTGGGTPANCVQNAPNQDLACGSGSVASPGTGTTALGINAKANGDAATALGASAIAGSISAVAVGQGANASATGAVAMGQGAQATGTSAVRDAGLRRELLRSARSRQRRVPTAPRSAATQMRASHSAPRSAPTRKRPPPIR
jgi:hypothetical protein